MLSAGCLFAEGSLYIEDNPGAAWKIINLDAQDIKNLTIKDYTTLIVKETERLKNVSAGDVLVAGACKEIPDGFIRKVVTVKKQDGRLIMETIEGTLADMLGGRLSGNAKPVPAEANPDRNR